MVSGDGTGTNLNSNLLRQSFDRFDDNLVSNILSYLPFREKVLYEWVSKKWKKHIYNKQEQLSLSREEDKHSLNMILEPIEVVDFKSASAVAKGFKQINKLWMNSLLTKCHWIEQARLDCHIDFDDLDIIFRDCPYLKAIEFNSTNLDVVDLDYLGRKYGDQLETVQINSCNVSAKYWNNLLIHCKNLKELNSRNVCDLFINDETYLPKLGRTKYIIYPKQNGKLAYFRRYDEFCEKFSQSLTKLNVSVYDEMKAEEIKLFFNSTCKLKNLTDLEFYFPYIQDDEHGIDKYVSKLSKSVPNLKRLRISIYSCSLKVDQLFYSFQDFKNLVNFDIYICGYNKYKSFEGSVECLKSSKNLKYLTISIETIGEEFFKHIDKHLPNLSQLIIECESEITDKTISQLSHLKELKEFYLYKCQTNNRKITDESVCAVINGCPALEKLCFSSRPNITSKSFEALIRCANNYTKRSLHFECGLSEDEAQHEMTAIDMNTFSDKIPNNLTMDYILASDHTHI